MPIRSESNQIKHHKTKDINVRVSGRPFWGLRSVWGGSMRKCGGILNVCKWVRDEQCECESKQSECESEQSNLMWVKCDIAKRQRFEWTCISESKCVQYIQNTINKVEVKYIKNNYKGIDVEGHRRVVIDMPKVYVCTDTNIWKVGTSLIRWSSGCEVILIEASWNNWITGWKWFRMVSNHMEWSQKACRIIWMGLANESGAPRVSYSFASV